MVATQDTAERENWHRTARAGEQRLFARLAAEHSPAARDAIMEQFMPLARKLARRYRNVEDIEDLEQIAAIGLMKAIDRFDPERGLAFSSFAFPTILGELKRHLRDRGWSVRPPRDIQELVARVEQSANRLASDLGRSPTVGEIAEHVGNTVEQVLEAMGAANARHAASLDQPRDADGPGSRGMEIAIDDPGFAAIENAVLVNSLMHDLTQRELVVLHLRFREDLTQVRIAEMVGLSQMHVSRMIRRAIEKLQAAAMPATTIEQP
ncbi:sigma-70 family RNA polymerase sigma factor [Solirubrobacter soli]|uniref:sigma-70 family RNA polymerase sigma factor n=1 Tax=Solirubrobacter soli TaxID=363832 RepID=UPI0003F57E9F|nr:sigma-70 family RNA polymerase sigma factor [Solirubrobacter soli]